MKLKNLFRRERKITDIIGNRYKSYFSLDPEFQILYACMRNIAGDSVVLKSLAVSYYGGVRAFGGIVW